MNLCNYKNNTCNPQTYCGPAGYCLPCKYLCNFENINGIDCRHFCPNFIIREARKSTTNTTVLIEPSVGVSTTLSLGTKLGILAGTLAFIIFIVVVIAVACRFRKKTSTLGRNLVAAFSLRQALLSTRSGQQGRSVQILQGLTTVTLAQEGTNADQSSLRSMEEARTSSTSRSSLENERIYDQRPTIDLGLDEGPDAPDEGSSLQMSQESETDSLPSRRFSMSENTTLPPHFSETTWTLPSFPTALQASNDEINSSVSATGNLTEEVPLVGIGISRSMSSLQLPVAEQPESDQRRKVYSKEKFYEIEKNILRCPFLQKAVVKLLNHQIVVYDTEDNIHKAKAQMPRLCQNHQFVLKHFRSKDSVLD